MHYELYFTKEAEETFDLIIDQLFDRWGLPTVIKFQELTSGGLAKISENPFLYPIVNDVTAIRRCILHHNYSILFHISEARIYIICFWDNRQNPLFD